MISISNLTFSFKKNKPLFRDLSIEMMPGKTYGLFGLNGAGKTTLLNHMTGLLFPDSGSCHVLNFDASNRSPEFLQQIFIVPEQFELPPVTPEVYIKLHAPFYPDFDETILTNTIQEFHIDPENKLTENSYGQRKKFLIAFALATKTKVLIMDEPTNGLDIPSKSQFRKIMAATDREDRCTVISTHQVRDLETMIDQITVLHDGSIIFDQSTAEISEHLLFQKVTVDQNPTALYTEDVPGGSLMISPRNTGKPETEINLELLFNGVISAPSEINKTFKSVEA